VASHLLGKTVLVHSGEFVTSENPVLDPAKSGRTLPRDSRAVMRQIGWLGHTGAVYAMDADPSRKEKGGYSPLYIQIGVWEYLGDGKYGIKARAERPRALRVAEAGPGVRTP
jgi:hypothetical protein